jgi:poly(hydroxyalkanoate) depolymerase family esterase
MTAFSTTMQNALRLTRAGNLRQATALIRDALRGDTGAATQAPIDVEFRVVDVGNRAAPFAESNPAAECAPAPLAAPERTVEPIFSAVSSAAAEPCLANIGRFVAGSFSNPAGKRAYKLWIPSGLHETSSQRPLIVMLHGCTQDADDFATGTRMNALADREGCFVLYPIQTGTANAQRCWCWFQESDQRRDAGEPSIIAEMTRQLAREYSIDTRRIYVAGLSAGAAMAVILGETYPDLFAAIGAHSGLPFGVAHNVPSALAAMAGRTSRAHRTALPAAPSGGHALPGIIFHGDADTTVAPVNSDTVVAQLCARHATDGTSLRRELHKESIYHCARFYRGDGSIAIEQWTVHGAGHAWSGGDSAGSYTNVNGPDASARMLEFFLRQERRAE